MEGLEKGWAITFLWGQIGLLSSGNRSEGLTRKSVVYRLSRHIKTVLLIIDTDMIS